VASKIKTGRLIWARPGDVQNVLLRLFADCLHHAVLDDFIQHMFSPMNQHVKLVVHGFKL